MKSHFAIAAAASLVASAACADMMSEQVVQIPSENGSFVATLNRADGTPAPVVLMLHGFTGSRNELPTEHVPSGIFAHTAQALAEAGYASLRIDFRGSGESTSDMGFAETTFEGQVSDALAALSWLQASDAVTGDDIYLLGWSQGGLVATAAAGRSGIPDAVALWAPVASPVETYSGILGAETFAAGTAAAADQPVTATLPWGAVIELNGAFFDGVESFDPTQEIAAYSGPLFIAQGSADPVVAPESADLLIAAHDGPEALWTTEMDHAFNAFATAETLDQMVGLTIGFFDAYSD